MAGSRSAGTSPIDMYQRNGRRGAAIRLLRAMQDDGLVEFDTHVWQPPDSTRWFGGWKLTAAGREAIS